MLGLAMIFDLHFSQITNLIMSMPDGCLAPKMHKNPLEKRVLVTPFLTLIEARAWLFYDMVKHWTLIQARSDFCTQHSGQIWFFNQPSSPLFSALKCTELTCGRPYCKRSMVFIFKEKFRACKCVCNGMSVITWKIVVILPVHRA